MKKLTLTWVGSRPSSICHAKAWQKKYSNTLVNFTLILLFQTVRDPCLSFHESSTQLIFYQNWWNKKNFSSYKLHLIFFRCVITTSGSDRNGSNLVPRVYSAFKLAAERRPWHTLGTHRYTAKYSTNRGVFCHVTHNRISFSLHLISGSRNQKWLTMSEDVASFCVL